MKFALARMSTGIIFTLGLAALGTGCQHKADSVPASSSVTDISAPSPSYSPNYAPAQPVYDTAPSQPVVSGGYASSSATSSVTAGSYVVKKGDTLYGIARQRYGDGKQWQKIASANPGLSPSSLKVGSTITIP